jgi:hypothetical protein
MKRSFLGCALFVGFLGSKPALSRGQSTSPVGTWQVSVLGADKGTLMMTFSNNFTVTGYGITRKQFGFITLAGSWSLNSKGDAVAAYIQTVNGAGSAFTLTIHILPSGRFRGKATGGHGGYRCKGEQPESFSDLTGSWNAAVRRKVKPLNESFVTTASSNYPAVFDVTGQGLSGTTSYTLSGAILVSSHDAVSAALNRTFGTDTQHSSLAGTFKAARSKMMLAGDDDTGAHLTETAVRQ